MPWPSRRTARRWRRHRATRQSSCGTPGQAPCCRRSMPTVLSTLSLSPTTVHISKLIEEPYPSHPFPLPVHPSPTNGFLPPYLSGTDGCIVEPGQSFGFLSSIGQTTSPFMEALLFLGTCQEE